jgi:histidyl-tRNA synthetase
LVAARAGGLPKPIKWYCVPEFYRYEKPQRGRTRSFHQWNVDVIGSDEVAADAEAMAVAIDGLRRLGLGSADVVLRLNDRRFVHRLLGELDVPSDDEPEILGCIDKLERDASARERLEAKLGSARTRRILDCCEKMPLDAAPELAAVIEACRELGIGEYVETDFHVVRGLAYYTGPVWEIFDRGRELRAVAGGGRYDHLIAAMGGPDLSALGFGMGDVVLGELLREKGLVPPRAPRVDVYVVPVGEAMCAAARQVLARLRRADVRADAPYGAVRVGKALKAADAAGARRAILVGPDEWRDGSVRVKDLASGEESIVRLEDLG